MTTVQQAQADTAIRSREEWRETLPGEVDEIADVLERDALPGDILRHVPSTTMEALRSRPNLLSMKLPADLGGDPLKLCQPARRPSGGQLRPYRPGGDGRFIANPV